MHTQHRAHNRHSSYTHRAYIVVMYYITYYFIKKLIYSYYLSLLFSQIFQSYSIHFRLTYAFITISICFLLLPRNGVNTSEWEEVTPDSSTAIGLLLFFPLGPTADCGALSTRPYRFVVSGSSSFKSALLYFFVFRPAR